MHSNTETTLDVFDLDIREVATVAPEKTPMMIAPSDDPCTMHTCTNFTHPRTTCS
jgi:hypothetical protein